MFMLDGPKDFFLMDMFEWYMETIRDHAQIFSEVLCFEFKIFWKDSETFLDDLKNTF